MFLAISALVAIWLDPGEIGYSNWVYWLVMLYVTHGVVVMMLLILPRPHSPADYMMAGGLATMLTLLAFFGVLVSTKFRAEAFYKKRPK